ncbi:cysteine hydrolase family protein [Vagococcus silagei]|uniref:Isochorismatase family protein n=1 Tax=Vagococcus silagei TaxID=2508885 RepID=A0A4S3AZU5_9ENTE|nr:isochorismatase family protein [Vagococcus silagei]THB60334.1 isochorismatase family protein [Vagococcus silagei]
MLLVIDIQAGTANFLAGRDAFIERVNQVILSAKEKEIPIIYVKQAMRGNLVNNLISEEADPVVTKMRPSAFTSPSFCEIVKKLEVDSFIVVGLMSNACIQSTVKAALDRQYPVTLIEDAHDSVIKPMRQIWNKKLNALGCNLVSTNQFISEN